MISTEIISVASTDCLSRRNRLVAVDREISTADALDRDAVKLCVGYKYKQQMIQHHQCSNKSTTSEVRHLLFARSVSPRRGSKTSTSCRKSRDGAPHAAIDRSVLAAPPPFI